MVVNQIEPKPFSRLRPIALARPAMKDVISS
jgi:hypothetical protein